MEQGEYDNIAKLEEQHWWYAGMRAIARSFVRRIGLVRDARILDAGCGAGGGLRWLAEFGPTTGVDLHPRAVAYSSRISSNVAKARVQTLPFRDDSFDLLTSFEVLYHLAVSDDVEALVEFRRVLRPGGWLLVRVPAHDWLRGAHDRQVHTRRRYGRRELAAKLERAGFDTARLSYVGAPLLPLAMVRRLFQRPDATHSDVTMPSPMTNSIMRAALSAERFWLARMNIPFGLSLLALARKTAPRPSLGSAGPAETSPRVPHSPEPRA